MPLPEPTPDILSLDLFVSVVAHGSISRAAAAHAMSQPSASARIARLEKVLGLQLIERTPSGSRPTPIGVLVADWATSVVAAVDELMTGVRAVARPPAPTLAVAASYTIAEYLVPTWLAALRRARTDAEVHLEVSNSARVVERIDSGRVLLGFVETSSVPRGLASLTVAMDELVVIATPEQQPAARARALRAADLARMRLVLREEGSGTREVFDLALRRAGVTPPAPFLELGSTSAIKRAVLGGAAPGVVSRLAVESELRSGELVVVPTSGLDLTRRLRAIWHTGVALPPLARELLLIARGRSGSRSGSSAPPMGGASEAP